MTVQFPQLYKTDPEYYTFWSSHGHRKARYWMNARADLWYMWMHDAKDWIRVGPKRVPTHIPRPITPLQFLIETGAEPFKDSYDL